MSEQSRMGQNGSIRFHDWPNRALLTLMLFSLAAGANAQLNESDSLHWQARFTSTGSWLEGNVPRFLTVNKLELARANSLWGVSSRNDYHYGTSFHIKTENDFLSFNYLYYKPLNTVYPYWMFLTETNYRRKIDQRYQVGPGGTWNILKSHNNLLKLSATASYEYSHYLNDVFDDAYYTGNRQIETYRLTGRIFGRHRFFKDKLRFNYEFWFQQSLQYKQNYRYYIDNSLEVPVSKRLSFKVSARYSYEHIELVGLKPYDLFVTYGLSITNF